jgi:hypothetical protein
MLTTFQQTGALVGMICIGMQARYGLGRHRQIISDADFRSLRLLNWIYSLVSVIISFSLLKISIALSLLRLSRTRWYSWALYILIGTLPSFSCPPPSFVRHA